MTPPPRVGSEPQLKPAHLSSLSPELVPSPEADELADEELDDVFPSSSVRRAQPLRTSSRLHFEHAFAALPPKEPGHTSKSGARFALILPKAQSWQPPPS